MWFRTLHVAAIAAALSITSSVAYAEDWVATKLRGPVMLHVDGHWTRLERGSTVPALSVIRTLRGGRVTFQRGGETIDVGGDTQIHIQDRVGQRFTTVHQFFGKVEVEAEARDVQHFAVQTPFLAAVVKGTRFTVVTGDEGARVSVQRGYVAVEDSDTHQSTLLSVGQSAETSAGAGAPLAVEGEGELPPVLDAARQRISTTPQDAANHARAAALEAGASSKAAERAAREAAKETEKRTREEAKGEKPTRGESKEEGGATRDAAKEGRDAAKEADKHTRSEGSHTAGSGNNGGGRGNFGDAGGGVQGNSGNGGGNGAGHSENSGGGHSDGEGGGNGGGGNGNSAGGSDDNGGGNGGSGDGGGGKKDKD